MADLIANLRVIQEYMNWSDDDMSRETGLSRRMWQYAKAGTNRLGSSSLAAIAKRFPGARDDVLAYLAGTPDTEPVVERKPVAA